MKKILLLSSLLISMNAISQEFTIIDTTKIICYYNYLFQSDSANRNSVHSHEMVLETGAYSSKFLSATKLYQDSLLFVYKDEPIDVAVGKILPLTMGSPVPFFCNFVIVKDFSKNGSITTRGYINKKYLKVTETQNLSWEMVNNRDTTILGLPCKQATTEYAGRKYRAWYTLSIPISNGPYKFGGLPGLIVSIADTQSQHRFDLIGIEKRKRKMFIIEQNPIDVTPEEFTKAIYLDISQLYNRIQNNDRITPSSDEAKANALNRLKSENNFIERY